MPNNPGMQGNPSPINEAIKQQLRTEVPNNTPEKADKESFWKKLFGKRKTK